jgi:diadenosine tetraphosphatase ApaH/serine/threonine PP2A family protein phosphatase
MPDQRGPVFVFNGDFVDRGRHQVEVIGLLLCLKIAMPDRIWLVRGNHEDRTMNAKYGFQEACVKTLGKEFGPKIYDIIHKAFDQLPVACLVAHRILVVHGGIGDGNWRLHDLLNVRRPITDEVLADPANRWIYNILWSDPIEDDSEGAVFGVHPSPRGVKQSLFAWNVTKTFCAVNGLGLVVRSHQSKLGSVGFDVMHESHLVRVFSARDYEDEANDGAVLFVTSAPEHPALLKVRPQVLCSVAKQRSAVADKVKGKESAKRRRKKSR